MNKLDARKQDRRYSASSDWVWEVLIFVTVVPGIVYGILSIGNLPVA